ncbi:MAG: IclR family transcriptional regulator C-terminal domain-containing protein, partial [Clostridiales bacterium]
DALPSKRLDSQIGYRVPAYCSSLGKCLLAALSADELAEIFTTADLIKYTVNTISTLAELKQHLRLVRSQGWAMDDQEFELGHRCIAAPVYDYRGEVIAAISVSGSLERLTDAVSPKIRAAV